MEYYLENISRNWSYEISQQMDREGNNYSEKNNQIQRDKHVFFHLWILALNLQICVFIRNTYRG